MLMNDTVNTQNEKRERNKQKIANKLLDYDLLLDKKQLKANKKLKVIEKDNDFKTREVKAKCNINTLVLKGGYVLGRFCLILTFVSCLLTFGGNIESFICNIPLIDGETQSDFLFTWKTVNEIINNNGVEVRNVTIYRLNLITAPIYTLFLIGMQSILYQVSITIHIIKLKFRAYYIYALIVQYSMLFYSVYSNYKFLSHYVRPDSLIESFMVFIPSLLLDISCIFFLSLSMRMKTLNFDNEVEDNLLLKLIKSRYKNGNNIAKIPDKKDKNIAKKIDGISNNIAKNLDEDSNIIAKKNRKYRLKNSNDFNKLIAKKTSKLLLDAKQLEPDIIGTKVAKTAIKKAIKTVAEKQPKTVKTITKPSNKNSETDYKNITKYIKKLKEKNIKNINVGLLLTDLKIDKNRWQKTRDRLILEGVVSFNGRTTKII